MTLLQRQSLFAGLVANLINEAYARGYTVTLGEAWRTPEQAAWNAAKGIGTSNSLHIDRLAIDLNLYKNGVWLTKSRDHKPLGDWWKKQHVDCRWGGDFLPTPDGNHYSMTPDGVRK